jgi:Tfp pilus assembly protein PilW
MRTRSTSILIAVAGRRREHAFTLAELMITVSLSVLLTTGIICGYLFELHMYEITNIKLGATDDARKALIKLTDEIRSAWKVQIGSGDLNSFTEVASNTYQQGNAIQISMDAANTNNWIRYWYETNAASVNGLNGLNTNYTKLLRTVDGANYSLVIAHSITNLVPVFTAEDSNGNVLTNNVNNRVIGMTLQFYQMEYPMVNIGPGNYYDFYQLRTRVTRRTFY